MNPQLLDFLLRGDVEGDTRSAGTLGRRFSGAAISRSNLVIVTLTRSSNGMVELGHDAAQLFTLAERDQICVRTLALQVQSYCARSRIDRLALRGSPESGSMTGAPLSYVIEGILHLLDDVVLKIHHAHTVSAQLRRVGEQAPETPLGVRKAQRFLYEQAIGAACIAAFAA